ncbi:MAG TPA: PAS domain S-box protein, partial [Candidatus Paceibacterota bacterium]|nr:PAS domain S-box protein [Candidatus Paceibacterota bacterium]
MENETRYKKLYEDSSDALMTIEPPDWKFTTGNRAALKMFRAHDLREFVAADPWKLSPEKQPDGRFSNEKAKEMINTALKDGFSLFDWVHRRIDGENFPANVLLTKMNMGGKSFVQATIRDVSEERRAAELIKERDLAEKMNKFMVGREVAMAELKKENEEL